MECRDCKVHIGRVWTKHLVVFRATEVVDEKINAFIDLICVEFGAMDGLDKVAVLIFWRSACLLMVNQSVVCADII